jgi:uncharacterized protein YbaP (TraB family)
MNYRVRDTDVFLMGTIHLLPPGTTLALDEQRSLVDAADEVIFESDLEHPPLPEGHFLESGQLADIIGKSLYDRVVALAVGAGYEEPVDRLKPWWLGLVLGVRLQLRAGATFGAVDRAMWDYTKSSRKARFVLERAEVFRAIDAAPKSESIAALQYLVDHPHEPVIQLRAIYQAWHDSDQIGLDAALSKTALIMPTVYRCLFEDRNRLWIGSVLQAIRNKKRAVFVVGCGHVAHGSASLQNLLLEHRFILEPVN